MDYEIRPLSEVAGSEIIGLNLSKPLDAETRQTLDRALADRGVLVFRNQSLDPASFKAAISNFGEIMPQQVTNFSLPEDPEVGIISNRDTDEPGGKVIVRGAQFHTDHSNYVEPPRATALCAVNIPQSGGDTEFVNVQAAYAALPEEMKKKVESLRSLHTYQSSRSPRPMAKLSPEERAKIQETLQPIAPTHPVNGRKGLYLNTGRMEGIEGMEVDAGFDLINRLMEHATKPEFEYRHKWRQGDLVIWDNYTVLHKANGDVPPDQLRYLYRLMVKGSRLH